VHTVLVMPGDEVAGRYRLEELQGRGPMSEVWRAHDQTLDRTVALKMLSATADLERFRREARSLAGLAHENVMRVFDYGEAESGPFMALEWLPNGTLEDRLGRGALPPAEARRIAQGIAAGLAHLHSRGLVHRDLKPANVLFDEEGRPKVADFGLARSAAGPGTLTEAGTVLGTAAYISPEQAAGEPASPASDVYSFGVILFRMLAGALPFVADDALALVDMHRHASAPAVESLQPDAPPDLAALTAAALRKDPADRPADGEALLAALGAPAVTAATAAADTEATQVLAPVPAPAAPGPAAVGRRTVLIALALLVLLVSGGLLAWVVTKPSASAPTGVTTGTVPGTGKTHAHTAVTTQAPPTSTQAQTSSAATTRLTTAHATTARPTTATVPSTSIPTTIATQSVPTTTAPTTTVPATTAITTGVTGTVGQSTTTTRTSTQSTTTAP
jgi:eukaryotic-like serine/threonine-protein kinase